MTATRCGSLTDWADCDWASIAPPLRHGIARAAWY